MTTRKKKPFNVMEYARENAQVLMIIGGVGGIGGSHFLTNSNINANAQTALTASAEATRVTDSIDGIKTDKILLNQELGLRNQDTEKNLLRQILKRR